MKGEATIEKGKDQVGIDREGGVEVVYRVGVAIQIRVSSAPVSICQGAIAFLETILQRRRVKRNRIRELARPKESVRALQSRRAADHTNDEVRGQKRGDAQQKEEAEDKDTAAHRSSLAPRLCHYRGS